MASGGFSGRQFELSTLFHLVDSAAMGHGGVVLVGAPAGGGKTALIDEFRRRLSERPASQSVLQLQGNCSDATGSANAYEPFAEALVGATTHGVSREGRRKNSLVVELLKNVAPDLLSMLPVIGPAAAAVSKAAATTGQWWLAALPDDLEALSRTITSQFIEAFISMADARGPLIIVIENAHWCDPSSAALLSRISQQVSRHQIGIVITYRPEGIREGHPLESSIAEMRISGVATRIVLDNFTYNELTEYVERRYGIEVTRSLSEWLFRHCGGHAIMVTNYLTLLEQSGALVQSTIETGDHAAAASGWRLMKCLDELPVPDSVQAVLAHRARWLNDPERRLLRLASVQGEDFLAAVLSGMLELDEDSVVTDLKDVELRHGLIAESAPAEWARAWSDGFAFEHELMRRMFYDTLTRRQRVRYHAAVGTLLLNSNERVRPGPRGLVIETAGHLERGEMWAEAAEQLRRAARSCYLDGAFDEATRLAERGLACVRQIALREEPDLARLEAKTIQMLLICSELAWWDSPSALAGEPVLDLLIQADRAAELANDRQLIAELTFLRAKVVLLRHSLTEALSIFELAVDQSRAAGDELGEVIGLTELGHHTVGTDLATGLALLEEAYSLWKERIEKFESMVSPTRLSRHLARLQVTLGVGFFDSGNFDSAQQWLDRSVSVLKNYRMPDLRASMASLHAQFLIAVGRFEEAESMIVDALATPTYLKEESVQRSYLLSLLGKLYLEWDKPAEADSALTRAFQQTLDSTNTAVLPLIRNYYCELLLCPKSEAYDLQTAGLLLESTILDSVQSGFRRSEVFARMLISDVHRRRGNSDGALVQSARALDLLNESGLLPTVRREETLFNHYLCLQASAHKQDSIKFLEMARVELERKASSISNSEGRDQFLNRIPLNREILRATRASP